jgi:hypothetical protein
MIEILPPLGKYKYDTWRILLVKCYIYNSVCLQSCIRNINNDAPGCDVTRATEHDVERLVALVGAGVGVRVVVDGLERSFGILQRHLLTLFALWGNLRLTLPLPTRCAIAMRLQLLLLIEPFCKLPDLPALLDAVALGVVHRGPPSSLPDS